MVVVNIYIIICKSITQIISQIYLLSIAKTCSEAGKQPGCCAGGPQACSVTANGKTCYCDHKCVAFNDCCADVPKLCSKQNYVKDSYHECINLNF